MKRYNVLEHELVPEHYLVPKEEESRILSMISTKKDSLPKIKRSDAVLKILEKIYGPIEEGRIIKVVRKSNTSGISEAFRTVSED